MVPRDFDQLAGLVGKHDFQIDIRQSDIGIRGVIVGQKVPGHGMIHDGTNRADSL
jgi:hypothetical protein